MDASHRCRTHGNESNEEHLPGARSRAQGVCATPWTRLCTGSEDLFGDFVLLDDGALFVDIGHVHGIRRRPHAIRSFLPSTMTGVPAKLTPMTFIGFGPSTTRCIS